MATTLLLHVDALHERDLAVDRVAGDLDDAILQLAIDRDERVVELADLAYGGLGDDGPHAVADHEVRLGEHARQRACEPGSIVASTVNARVRADLDADARDRSR